MVNGEARNVRGIWVVKELRHPCAPLQRVGAVEGVEVVDRDAAAERLGNGKPRVGPERLAIAEHAIHIKDHPFRVERDRRERWGWRHAHKPSGARTLTA